MMPINDLSGARFFGLPFLYIGNLDVKIFHSACHLWSIIGVGSIIVTDERRESVDFVEYYPAAFVLVVRAISNDNEKVSFLDNIKDNINKTFIRENRWIF